MTAEAGKPGRMIGQEALELDVDLQAGRRPAGRVEQLVAGSLDAACRTERLDPDLDAGAAALAVSMARAIDRSGHDAYAVAAVGRELSALLARLKLDPVSREGASPAGGIGDQAGEWLRRVTEPR